MTLLLLIEVSDSTLRYDLETKARLYATNGIAEYWVVDLVAQCVWRHRAPQARRYAELEQVRAGTLPLPGRERQLDVTELFRST